MVSLILMSYARYSSATELSVVLEPNPAGLTCLSLYETKMVADYKKNCDVLEANLKDTEQVLQQCMGMNACEKSMLDSRAVFWSGIVTAFVLGFLSAAASR